MNQMDNFTQKMVRNAQSVVVYSAERQDLTMCVWFLKLISGIKNNFGWKPVVSFPVKRTTYNNMCSLPNFLWAMLFYSAAAKTIRHQQVFPTTFLSLTFLDRTVTSTAGRRL